MAWRSW